MSSSRSEEKSVKTSRRNRTRLRSVQDGIEPSPGAGISASTCEGRWYTRYNLLQFILQRRPELAHLIVIPDPLLLVVACLVHERILAET